LIILCLYGTWQPWVTEYKSQISTRKSRPAVWLGASSPLEFPLKPPHLGPNAGFKCSSSPFYSYIHILEHVSLEMWWLYPRQARWRLLVVHIPAHMKVPRALCWFHIAHGSWALHDFISHIKRILDQSSLVYPPFLRPYYQYKIISN
jgi:hypothetical protein